uniref:RagB/SusD family nutrient uptake outer membrane protein n=1 Tax=uncultured Draconibacterium sp. TaxID=1573823 RepID=UPI0032163DDF
MKFKYYIIILLSVIMISSCENALVEKPFSFTAPTQFFNTEDEVEAALYGAYNFFHYDWIGGFHILQMGDLGTDVGLTRPLAFYDVYQRWNMDNLTVDYRNAWLQRYQGISSVNLVISRVENSDFSDAFKNEIIAEAKFIRAYFYNQLYLMYGGVPLWTNELTDLDKVANLPRSSAEEVFAQIIMDLEFAEEFLPSTREANERGRVTKWAAKGLMARVYLFDDQWKNAKDKAEEIINESPHTLISDLQELFDFKNRFNSELIHVINKETDIKGSKVHSFSSPRGRDENGKLLDITTNGVIRPDGIVVKTTNELFQGWGVYQAVKEHYDSFESGDRRKSLWWHELKREDGTVTVMDGGTSGSGGYYNLKWLAFDEEANNGSRDVHMQRLAELYLISAEAENELNGPTVAAYSRINEIRRRAFGDTEHDLSGLSKDEFRNAIIRENRWELGGEGHRRWYLIHWGWEVLNAAVQSVAVSNPIGASNIKPHHMLFKISDEEIIVNPNIEQNPGY